VRASVEQITSLMVITNPTDSELTAAELAFDPGVSPRHFAKPLRAAIPVSATSTIPVHSIHRTNPACKTDEAENLQFVRE
jgi:hypothetical protein